MKLLKVACAGSGIAWVLAFAYLQLSALPALRSCVLGESGGIAIGNLAGALGGCINNGFTLLAILLATLFVVAVFCLWKKFPEIYDWLSLKKKEWLIAATVVAVAALPFLSRGNVVLGDAMQFSALSIFMKNAITTATYPYWTPIWYMGSAPLAFYGWLSFLLTGALNIFMGIDLANKLAFFLTHIASSMLAYKLVNQTTNSKKAAVIGALIYGLSFEHIARIMIGRSITSL